MIDITWFLVLASIAPVVFALSATMIFIRYPDRYLSTVLFSSGLTSILGLFDLLTEFEVIEKDGFIDLAGNIFQAAGALIGILGAFLVYYIDLVKKKVARARREVTRHIDSIDEKFMYASDKDFVDYLRRWCDTHMRPHERGDAVRQSLHALAPMVGEEERVKLIATNQIGFLFLAMLMSIMSLLFADSLDFSSAHIKVLAYFMLSFAATAFISSIYGVYRVIYPDVEV